MLSWLLLSVFPTKIVQCCVLFVTALYKSIADVIEIEQQPAIDSIMTRVIPSVSEYIDNDIPSVPKLSDYDVSSKYGFMMENPLVSSILHSLFQS